MSGRRRPWTGILLAGAGIVVAWKAAALALAWGSPAATPGSLLVKVLLALVGLAFPACGLWTWWRRPDRAGLLFAAFTVCAGLHWGGPLELPAGELRTALILLYLLISSLLGETLFLHLALVFPRPLGLAARRWPRRLLYAPAAAAALLTVAYLVVPADGAVRAAVLDAFLLGHAAVSNLFPLLALVIFVAHLVRPGLDRRRKRYVALMVAGMLIAWLPHLVAAAAGVETDPWNLTVVALPVAFAIGIPGIARRRDAAG